MTTDADRLARIHTLAKAAGVSNAPWTALAEIAGISAPGPEAGRETERQAPNAMLPSVQVQDGELRVRLAWPGGR